MNLDNESTISALKKLHKLQMKDWKLQHTLEKNRLKSALAKWENGVSAFVGDIDTNKLLNFLRD